MGKNAVAKVFILCLGLTTLQAQTDNETMFRFGIHGSPNISYVSTDDPLSEGGALLRFGFGLIAEYRFAENYGLATGINVVNRGGKLSNDTITGTYKSQFLQIPIRLKMNSREFGYFTYFAEFGGSFDFELSEEVSFNRSGAGNVLESYVRPVNVLFTIGAGTEYSLGGKTALVGGIYYNRSLIDNLNDDHAVLVSGNSNYRFDYVSLKLGVLF